MEELRVRRVHRRRSEAVNARLGAHRDQVEQLSGVRGLISKLQAVFELPRKMRTCLDRGAVALAVRYYAAAAPFAQVRRRARSAGESARRTPPPPTPRKPYDARSRTPPTPARRRERAAARARAIAEAENERAAAQNEPAAETPDADPAVTSASSDLSASECVELLELLGTPRGALHGEYLSSRRPQLEASVAAAESASVSCRWPDSGSISRAPSSSSSSSSSFDASFLEDFAETAAGTSNSSRTIARLSFLWRRNSSRGISRLRNARTPSTASSAPPPRRRRSAIVGVDDGKTGGDPSRVSRGRIGDRAAVVGARFADAWTPRPSRSRRNSQRPRRRRRRSRRAPAAARTCLRPRGVLPDPSPPVRGAQRRAAHGGERRAGGRPRVLEERPAMVAPWRTEFGPAIRARVETVPDALVARLAADAEGTDAASRRADGNVPAGTSPLAARPATGPTGRVPVVSALPPARLLSRARLASFLATDGAAHVARALESFFPDTDAVGEGAGGSFDAEGVRFDPRRRRRGRRRTPPRRAGD